MKVFNYVWVVLFLLGMTTASANDFTTRVSSEANDPQIKVMSVKDNKYRIFYQGTQKENVRLTIYDKDREKVYSEAFKGTLEFAKLYDFTKMPQGVYFIEFSGKGWRKKEKVELLKLGGVEALEAKLTQMGKNDKVFLQIDNPEIKEVTLLIENSRGEIMFNDKVELDAQGGRVFRFEGFIQGAYTFRIFSGTVAKTEVLSLDR